MRKPSFWQLLLRFVRALKEFITAFCLNVDGNAGLEHPWVGEDMHPHPNLSYWAKTTCTGRDKQWLSTTSWLCLQPSHLHSPLQAQHDMIEKGPYKHKHSTWYDLIITGHVGLHPSPGDLLRINLLLPFDTLIRLPLL